jgi:dTMP kinase
VNPERGCFIVLEGVEGAGKTTQIPRLAAWISSLGRSVITTVEPGGTAIGRQIRAVLLDTANTAMSATTELLLYNAARAQHVSEVILPALESGVFVVCDRYSDSTMAYQGYARGLDRDMIGALDGISTGGLKPDLTIILDLPVEAGRERNVSAGKSDRLELESAAFHERVRAGFDELAAQSEHAVSERLCL